MLFHCIEIIRMLTRGSQNVPAIVFNNISVVSWQSFLLVAETSVPEENHWPTASSWQTLSHIVVSHLFWACEYVVIVNNKVMARMKMMSALYKTSTLSWIYVVLTRTNQSLLILLYTACYTLTIMPPT